MANDKGLTVLLFLCLNEGTGDVASYRIFSYLVLPFSASSGLILNSLRYS